MRAKDSYKRDEQFFDHLKRLLGKSAKIKYITPGKIESYQRQRLDEPSRAHKGEKIKPATVNKEVIILKVALNRAVRHGKLHHNQIATVKKLPENNIRTRLLTQKEFDGLLEKCPLHIRPVVMIGYYMGPRLSEIINLTWPESRTFIARLSKNPKNRFGGTRKPLILRHVNLPKS